MRLRKAAVIYADRYWPGLEFYFGEAIYYVADNLPRQRPSDTGICEALGEPRFFTHPELSTHLQRDAGRNVWFVRYKGKASSPLTEALQQAISRETVRVGDFLLNRAPTRAVADKPRADTSRIALEF